MIIGTSRSRLRIRQQQRQRSPSPVPAFMTEMSTAPASRLTIPRPGKPKALYPPAVVSFAMVAHGEIGFLISSLAQSEGIFDSSASFSKVESEFFLIVTWAIVLCTLTGPFCVGLLVRRVKQLDTEGSSCTAQEGLKNVLRVWSLRAKGVHSHTKNDTFYQAQAIREQGIWISKATRSHGKHWGNSRQPSVTKLNHELGSWGFEAYHGIVPHLTPWNATVTGPCVHISAAQSACDS